jgi:hypothetical protein
MYMKYEGVNLDVMTLTLKFVLNYELLGLEVNFQGTCFGHALSQAYQYGTTNEKVCKSFRVVSLSLPNLICKLHNLVKTF